MSGLDASVGKLATNMAVDVDRVRARLIAHRRWLGGIPVAETGPCDDLLCEAIMVFQANAAALLNPDGRVDPGGFTWRRLSLALIQGPRHAVFREMCWARGGGLTLADFQLAATRLGCEVNAIRAVAQIEAPRGAFQDSDGRPTILFERHYFRALTGGAYDATHPDLSGPQGAYGRFSDQYPKLTRAAMLDESAALQSASWGMFQITGRYRGRAASVSIDDFVTAMNRNEQAHLDAFVDYILDKPAAARALVAKDWNAFAIAYNGAAQAAEGGYGPRIAAAYQALQPPVPQGRR